MKIILYITLLLAALIETLVLGQASCSGEEMAILDAKMATLKAAIELLLDMKQNNPEFDPNSNDVQQLYLMMKPIIAAADSVQAPEESADLGEKSKTRPKLKNLLIPPIQTETNSK